MCEVEFCMEMSDKDLTDEFNEVCLDTVFAQNDYSIYPVYDTVTAK
jgi:hypothetical protein